MKMAILPLRREPVIVPDRRWKAIVRLKER
jgi:hypothetical protein